LPEVDLAKTLAHPRAVSRAPLFEPIKDWEYVNG
jgi:hypothetical protein